MLHLNHLIITILINKELLLKNFCFCAHRAERALYVVSHYQLWCLAWFLSSPSAPLPTEKAISRVSHKLWDQSRKKLKEHYYFRGSADGLPHSNHAGQKMLIIPIFHFHFFSVIKTTHPSCHQTSTSPNDLLVSRNAFSSWTLLSWFPLFQDTYAPDGLPDAGIYLNCLLLPVLALCGHRAESDTEIGSPWHAGLVSSSRPLLPGPNLLPSDPSNTASHVYHFNLTLTSETKYLPYVFWRKASSWFFFPHHLLNTAFFVFFPQGPLLATFQRCDILPL